MKNKLTMLIICLSICISVSAKKIIKFIQTGKASWYGKEFDGRKTASGERFNMYGLTAAHKSLPFGTLVKVTNVRNGLSVIVRINDRGPNLPDRVIDLSYAAAKTLRLTGYGIQKVKLEIL
jgi:rare lipoprotein A